MPLLAPKNPMQAKKVTWLELFFDLIFALALAMSAKPLESVSDLSAASFLALGKFIILFAFLVMFWYKHMVLVNRFEHSSFLFNLLTLLIGFFVIAFTQFIRIWQVDANLGSFLATIAIVLATLSIATLYFISSIKMGFAGETSGEKTWSRATAKHLMWQAVAFLFGLVLPAQFIAYWFIGVFIYFNRYPFETYLNPKKQSTLNPALTTLPPENFGHKSERIGLFSLLTYGLVIVLAANPLLNTATTNSVEGLLGPILIFGKIFLYISIIWYLQFRVIEVAQPKTNQFTVMVFVTLGLLVASTHFMRVMLAFPGDVASSILFSICTALILSIIAVAYWNVKMIAGLPPPPKIIDAFRQWSYFLYILAAAFIGSIFFPSPIKENIWGITTLVAFIALTFERRLSVYYLKSMESKQVVKFLDNQTFTGLALVILAGIGFFVLTALMGKSIASLWIFTWLIPLVIGFFILLNHWMHTRIRPN